MQVDAEHDDQEQTGEEGRHGEADEGEGRSEVVEDRVALHGRDHPDGDRQGDAEDVRDADHGKRVREPLDKQVNHGKVAHEGVAEVAFDEREEPLHVSDVPRLIQPQLFADVLADFGWHVRIRRELTERVAGGKREDRIDDKADHKQGRDGDQ